MNANRVPGSIRVLLLLVASVCLMPKATVSAASFSYTNCDLLAAFRQTGGASDLVVNLGPAAYYETLPARTVLSVTNLQLAQLNAAFPTLNGIIWSVSGAARGNTNYPQYALQTLWVSAPRPDINTPAPVWTRRGQFTLGPTASQIEAIGAGAVTSGNAQPAGLNNTATGIVLSATDPTSYTALIARDGNFDGTFQGSVENTTPEAFSSEGLPSRSVLYQLAPGPGDSAGRLLGFFDFSPDGGLTFTAGPPPERTIVTSFRYAASLATLSFSTIDGVSYRLRATEAANVLSPVSSWNIAGATLVGDGAERSLQVPDATADRFYVVEAFY